MNFLTKKRQTLKSRLLINLSLLLLIPFVLVLGLNYKLTTDQFEERIIAHELPALTNNLHSEIKARLKVPATLSKSMANNVFVQEWLLEGEQDEQKLGKFLGQSLSNGNLLFSNLISANTKRIYENKGYIREVDRENPIDQWYFEFIEGAKDQQLVLGYLDDEKTKLTLFLDDKVKDPQGKLIGVIGLAIDMNEFAETVYSLQIGEKGRNFLIDGQGIKKIARQGDDYIEDIKQEAGLSSIASSILSEEDGAYTYEINGETYLVNVRYFPEYDWYVIAEVSLAEMLAPINNYYRIILLVGILVLAAMMLVAYFFTDMIVKPIVTVSNVAKKIAQGDFNVALDDNSSVKELTDLNEGFNTLIRAMSHTTDFAQEIAKGNLQVTYDTDGQESALGKSLINMRDELKRVEQEGKQRNWVTQGIAKFSEMLRASDQELEVLADQLISELVKYVGANQGGLFVLEGDEKEPYLEMVACYAYNRKKYLKHQVKIGEGLAGQAFLEQDKIYMTDVPEEYIRIRSGLGDASPQAVLIVPMKLNEEVLGIIELASFTPFEEYKIEFIEKVGEAIASTLTMVRNNQQMKALYEDSQEQAEMMKAQEEEMRQNMEELQATQEEMARKEREYQEKIMKLESEEV